MLKTLMDQYAVDCVLYEKRRVDDPVGGYKTEWTDGITFSAAWEFQSAPEITVAEQQGVSRVYNIYVDKTLELEYHDYFRRTDTGKVYRVINPGTDRNTPTFSRIDRRLIQVEQKDLPHDGV